MRYLTLILGHGSDKFVSFIALSWLKLRDDRLEGWLYLISVLNFIMSIGQTTINFNYFIIIAITLFFYAKMVSIGFVLELAAAGSNLAQKNSLNVRMYCYFCFHICSWLGWSSNYYKFDIAIDEGFYHFVIIAYLWEAHTVYVTHLYFILVSNLHFFALFILFMLIFSLPLHYTNFSLRLILFSSIIYLFLVHRLIWFDIFNF